MNRYIRIGKLKAAGLISLGILLFSVLTSLAQAPSPVACYNFSGNLSEAGGGTPLTAINGLGTYSTGAAACGTDSFYNWAVDQGIDLPIGTTFPKNNYTVEVLFKFTSNPYQRLWQRIVDFKNNTSDLGFYSYGSGGNYNLQMYTQNTGTTNMAANNTWLHIFLTRDAATNQMNAYINDSLQVSFNDNLSAGVFTSDLILFKDDNAVPNEESAGTIDYLRVYNQPLTKAQITYILNLATPAISISGNNSICSGDSTLLIASGATSYLWSNGATTDSVYVSPSLTTQYSVTAWNNLFCARSCPAYDSITVTVGSAAVANAGPDTTLCEGGYFRLHVDSGSSYLWQPSKYLSDSSAANPRVIPLSSITYTVTVMKGSCAWTDTVSVTVLPSPKTPSITQSFDTLTCTVDSDYVFYQWYTNNAPLQGDTTPQIIVSADGNYNLEVKNKYGCSIAVGITVMLTGIPQLSTAGGGEVRIFPNPVSGMFTLNGLYVSESNASIKIYTVLGEELYINQIKPGTSNPEIDIFSFAPGIYFAEVKNGTRITTLKLVKQ